MPFFKQIPQWLRERGVGNSEELRRIFVLPRRGPKTPFDYVFLRQPGSTTTLRPIQQQALQEAAEQGGLFAPIGVGQGKTLLSMLLPAVLKAQRPVLMVPPRLLDATYRRAEALRKDWLIPKFEILAYSTLSTAKGANRLEELRPDLIVCDEAHALKSTKAARTKRFLRYFKAHPETRLCVLSGTMTSKSVKDYAHLAYLALRDGSPVPRQWKVLDEWAMALDPNPLIDPGALEVFGLPVREGYRKRLVETPGVVATSDDILGTGLTIYERKIKPPEVVVKALKKLESTWETPGGEEFSTALDKARHESELYQGFYYKWVWPEGTTPEMIHDWLRARGDWMHFLREVLKRSRAGLDSPALVETAVNTGKLSGPLPAWAQWRKTIRPSTQAVWLDDYLLKDAVDWAAGGGIVWYQDQAVGARLKAVGFPVYGAGEDAELATERSIACSIEAQGTGRNLQYRYSRNLLMDCPPGGATMEQLLGRTHRIGQPEDEVEVYVYPWAKAALRSAIEDAKYAQQTLGASQKILQATVSWL